MKYEVMLIPDNGDARTLRALFNVVKDAADHGVICARDIFPGQLVEVVVIERRTREAVENIIVGEDGQRR